MTKGRCRPRGLPDKPATHGPTLARGDIPLWKAAVVWFQWPLCPLILLDTEDLSLLPRIVSLFRLQCNRGLASSSSVCFFHTYANDPLAYLEFPFCRLFALKMPRQSGTKVERTRTFTGCRTCRSRHAKCDEGIVNRVSTSSRDKADFLL